MESFRSSKKIPKQSRSREALVHDTARQDPEPLTHGLRLDEVRDRLERDLVVDENRN